MASDTPRFEVLNAEDLKQLLEEADSKNTKRQIKYAVSIFQDYCSTCNVGDIKNMIIFFQDFMQELAIKPVSKRYKRFVHSQCCLLTL